MNDLYRSRRSRSCSIWLLAHTLPLPTPVSKLDPWAIHRKTEKERQVAGGRGRKGLGGGGVVESYDLKKPGSSINHSILSGREELSCLWTLFDR